MLKRPFLVALLLNIPCVAAAEHPERLSALRLVTASGLAAPGLADGISFDHFAPISRNDDLTTPLPNRDGSAAFFASLMGPDVDESNDGSVWSEAGGALHLVAREGTPAPGLPEGVHFRELDPFLYFSDSGATLFHATLSGPGIDATNDSGLWIEEASQLRQVVRTGDPVVDDLVVGALSNHRLNDRGEVAYLAHLSRPGLPSAGTAVIRDGALVTRTTEFAPGTLARFRQFSGGSLVLSNSGDVAFLAFLDTDEDRDSGIWRMGAEGVLIAREGDRPPGFAQGEFGAFSPSTSFSNPAINSNGDVALLGGVRRAPVSNHVGAWLHHDGTLRSAAVNEFPAEEGLEVVSINQSDGELPLVLNARGTMLFRGQVINPAPGASTRDALVRIEDHTLRISMQELDLAPGTEEGTYFRDVGFNSSDILLNAAGQFAFVAALGGPSVTADNELGLWALSRQGDLRLIVRSGDEIAIAPGDLRTVELISLTTDSGNDDGRRSGLSDMGHVGFKVTFTDGTRGMFVSGLVAAPEPGGISLAIVLICLSCAAVRFLEAGSKPHEESDASDPDCNRRLIGSAAAR